MLGSLFLIISLGLALLSRTPAGGGVEEEGRRLSIDAVGPNWLETELNPPQSQNDYLDDFQYVDIFNQNTVDEDPEETQ